MGKAIKIDNANFASRGLGQIHWCKYDISYCTLYKYLIGDSNSYIDLGIKCSKYNIKKVKATIMANSTNWRFIIGNTRYISSSSQSFQKTCAPILQPSQLVYVHPDFL